MLILNWAVCSWMKSISHFKTSYVDIKQKYKPAIDNSSAYFKTSYVDIKQNVRRWILQLGLNFKTSYVDIKLNVFLLF